MKKLLLIISIILLLPALSCEAKKEAKIKFAQESYNFGKIAEKGGSVTHTFEFTNTGDANLVILDARADCGCTVPQFPKEPIAPGKKGKIIVTFNPLYRPGSFTKVVTIKSNARPKKSRIKITGVVTQD